MRIGLDEIEMEHRTTNVTGSTGCEGMRFQLDGTDGQEPRMEEDKGDGGSDGNGSTFANGSQQDGSG